MASPTLYLLIGHPGAGKTTTAKIIAETTGAVHLWADAERHKLFANPTHALAESTELYEQLNKQADELLARGKSVVFDTNFNYYADRLKLSNIASQRGAKTVVVWVTTPIAVSRDRAVCSDEERNGYTMNMSGEQFDAIVSKLEPPREDEKVIKLDMTKLDNSDAAALFRA